MSAPNQGTTPRTLKILKREVAGTTKSSGSSMKSSAPESVDGKANIDKEEAYELV